MIRVTHYTAYNNDRGSVLEHNPLTADIANRDELQRLRFRLEDELTEKYPEAHDVKVYFTYKVITHYQP